MLQAGLPNKRDPNRYHALLNGAPASFPITCTCACQAIHDNTSKVLHKLCCPLPPNHVHRPHLDCRKCAY